MGRQAGIAVVSGDRNLAEGGYYSRVNGIRTGIAVSPLDSHPERANSRTKDVRAYFRQRHTQAEPSVEGGFGGFGTGVVGTRTFGTAGRRGFGGRSCFGTSSYGMAGPPDGYGG
jgi:hypothetical protein